MTKRIAKKKLKFHSPIVLVMLILVFVIVSAYWSVEKFIVAPASVNRIVTGVVRTQPVLDRAPAGCHYQDVQCIKAPCNPILVCDDNVPAASVSVAPVPSSWPHPGSSCIPRPKCLDSTVPCKVVTNDLPFCATPPSPSPNPIPSPYASTAPYYSPLPSPMQFSPVPSPYNPYSCAVQVYKLRDSDSLDNLNLLITPDRRMNESQLRASPGERYLYEVVAINNADFDANLATLSAVTNNVHGFDEPIKILKTSPDCQAESRGKYMSCNQQNLVVPSGSAKLTNINMAIEIQASLAKTYNTSTVFSLAWLRNSIGYHSQCGVMMLSATPSPSPSIAPRSSRGWYTCRLRCLSKWGRSYNQCLAACR